MSYALITGASYGIGEAMAKIMAQKGHNLILVARTQQKLETLSAELKNVDTVVIAMDLSERGAGRKLYQHIQDNNLQVNYLINNAGIGERGDYMEFTLERQDKIMQLNMTTLAELTKLVLDDFKKKGEGQVLNVGSVASFVPGPYMTIYHATKAFVLSFSESLHEELKPYGIGVSTLCPGPTQTRKNQLNKREGEKTTFLQSMLLMTPHRVAKKGYEGMRRNKCVIIPGFFNKAFVFLMGLLPRGIIRKILRKMLQNV